MMFDKSKMNLRYSCSRETILIFSYATLLRLCWQYGWWILFEIHTSVEGQLLDDSLPLRVEYSMLPVFSFCFFHIHLSSFGQENSSSIFSFFCKTRILSFFFQRVNFCPWHLRVTFFSCNELITDVFFSVILHVPPIFFIYVCLQYTEQKRFRILKNKLYWIWHKMLRRFLRIHWYHWMHPIHLYPVQSRKKVSSVVHLLLHFYFYLGWVESGS